MSDTTSWWCEYAYVLDRMVSDVRVVAVDGVITKVDEGVRAQPEDDVLRGVVIPGLANAHSHAFHRALRGRTHDDGGTFWTWRDVMYRVATRLTPDSYFELARAAYAEMALAGVTCVGEFHYVHHKPGGEPYDNPLAMAEALRAAATEAGLRITLLDTCYLSGGLNDQGHLPLSAEQQRFTDGSAEQWARRALQLRSDPRPTPGGLIAGSAIHSVRAVPREDLATVAKARPGAPLHIHVSEQPAENDAATAFYGKTPTELLDEAGALGSMSTAVHATHLTQRDISLLKGSWVCLCPTTERDLADGIGPAGSLYASGVRLTVGSDQHAQVDLLGDAYAVEMHERLATHRRGTFAPTELLKFATVAGHVSLGWSEWGMLRAGSAADLVAIDMESVRTAGVLPQQVVFAATAADVTDVVCGGERIVTDREHRLGDVGGLLRRSIEALHE